jgi:8-amino-7-oxononanoate synthase
MTTRAELLRRAGLSDQRIAGRAGAHVLIGGRSVLNFTSSTYLGLHDHPRVLRALSLTARSIGISLGIPRALGVDHITRDLENAIARLVRQERALVFTSTTHLALDVLPLLVGARGTIAIDERAYPLSFEGAHAAARHGAALRTFRHNDPDSLQRVLHHSHRPIAIVVDGVYPAGGYPAALREFDHLARRYGAWLYVDDAHGLGVLGAEPKPDQPYGEGGGGTPLHCGIKPDRVLHVGSLSKAFGIPLAFVAGPARVIERLGAAASFVHASPPAPPLVAAAVEVLRIHAALGDRIRRRVLDRVLRFRDRVFRSGSGKLGASLFPLQTLPFETAERALAVGCALRAHDIWPVVQLNPPDRPRGGVLRWAITARHTEADLDRVVDALGWIAAEANDQVAASSAPVFSATLRSGGIGR